jgi:hypothetical protein
LDVSANMFSHINRNCVEICLDTRNNDNVMLMMRDKEMSGNTSLSCARLTFSETHCTVALSLPIGQQLVSKNISREKGKVHENKTKSCHTIDKCRK